jgi:hypothetical protein
MLKKYTLITFSVIIIISLLSSCTGMRTAHSVRAGNFIPNTVDLRLTMEDFELLGVQEVTVSYKKYLGFITFLNEINGQEVAQRNVNIVYMNGSTGFPTLKLETKLLRALYSSLVNHPETDFVVPVSIVTDTHQMFGGSTITKKLKVKLYKIKDRKG